MGEAKQRARVRADAFPLSAPIDRRRFNLYAIGTRMSLMGHIAQEISWWATADESLLGVVILDRIDNDYGWLILARDAIGRFRCISVDASLDSQFRAEEALRLEIARMVRAEDIAALGDQGDTPNAPIDLLRVPPGTAPEKLHPYFRELLERPSRSPGRAVIREIGPWLTPKDPHLVEEFQCQAFDQRLWELYLWAAFREFGLDVEQLEAPDFRCTAPGIDFTVEATTAAPSTMGPLASHPDPKTAAEIEEFLRGYMPIKYGSALHSKLMKTNAQGLHYWEREESKGKPFLLAIADFHKPATEGEPASLTFTQSALWQYLYGHRVRSEMRDGALVIIPEPVAEHGFGEKRIPSGFFDQPLAENVSAVIFSNAGTIAKFDRMGVVAGFAEPGVRYVRFGLRYNSDPNAAMGTPFFDDVQSPDYEEWWTDEVQVFHNPRAVHPLEFMALPGATHHYFEEGDLRTFAPEGSVLSSYTMLMTTHDADNTETPVEPAADAS